MSLPTPNPDARYVVTWSDGECRGLCNQTIWSRVDAEEVARQEQVYSPGLDIRVERLCDPEPTP